MEIEYSIVDCELGKMIVARTPAGICAAALGDDEESLADELRWEHPRASLVRNDAGMADEAAAVLAGLSGQEIPSVRLDVRGTEFQKRVWAALREIGRGETVSYRGLAELLGIPGSVRAVAGACASNRVAVLIPCHRVIASDGKLTGYRWGLQRKRLLLERESAG